MPRKRFEALPSRKQILDFIASSDQPAGKREIARAFGLSGQAKIDLKRLLKILALHPWGGPPAPASGSRGGTRGAGGTAIEESVEEIREIRGVGEIIGWGVGACAARTRGCAWPGTRPRARGAGAELLLPVGA